MIKVLLATPDAELTERTRVLLAEAGDLEVAATASTAREVFDVLASEGEAPDVLVLHEGLGPMPVLDLARDLSYRMPQLGVILLAANPSVDLLRAAMSAGIRSVAQLPLTFAEVSAAIVDAGEWSHVARDRFGAAQTASQAGGGRGRILAVAGSKGGVGTTMLAVQLALELQRDKPDERVCLLDFDLQAGDIRSYLDISHRRSISDLVDVATELTTGHLQDAFFAHTSGLRVLLPPVRGEDAEDLNSTVTARVLGGIRARFDTVVIDVGAVVSEASATAIEQADEVLVVCVPDVVSLRGANRATELWRRLSLREEGVRAVLNRASKDREVQPGLVQRVVNAPMVDTVLPDRPGDVEHATNAGDPARLEGGLRTAVEALSRELATPTEVPAEPAEDAEQRLEARVSSERGSIAAEFVGLILPIFAVLMLVWQFILTGYTIVQANRAADDGARYLAIERPHDDADGNELRDLIQDAAEARLHGHWRRQMSVTDVVTASEQEEVEVQIDVPMLAPGITSPWTITTSTGALVERSMTTPSVRSLGEVA